MNGLAVLFADDETDGWPAFGWPLAATPGVVTRGEGVLVELECLVRLPDPYE